MRPQTVKSVEVNIERFTEGGVGTNEGHLHPCVVRLDVKVLTWLRLRERARVAETRKVRQ